MILLPATFLAKYSWLLGKNFRPDYMGGDCLAGSDSPALSQRQLNSTIRIESACQETPTVV